MSGAADKVAPRGGADAEIVRGNEFELESITVEEEACIAQK